MDGIINLNKPVGITSAKALYRVRALTGQRKSGHGGTLDPAASGVLILCLGRATKLVERIMDQPKVYRATARLDVTSESFDSDRPMIAAPVLSRLTEERGEGERLSFAHIDEALREFEGEIQQIPPAISAVKIGGQPAYKRKATDSPLDLKPRPVRIYWIHLRGYEWPMIDFEMCCGRGTYVRALIRDLGERLGTGGCLTSLVRTRVGPFTMDDAWTLSAIREMQAAGDRPASGQQRTIIVDSRPAVAIEGWPRSASRQNGGRITEGAAPYLVPFDEALQLLARERIVVPPRP